MAPYSDGSKLWRQQNKDSVQKWQTEMNDLRNLANLENWTHERLDIEVAQRLDTDLRKIWEFCYRYTARYRGSNLAKFFGEALAEIREYGTLEPSRKRRLLKAIETTGRKMHGKR